MHPSPLPCKLHRLHAPKRDAANYPKRRVSGVFNQQLAGPVIHRDRIWPKPGGWGQAKGWLGQSSPFFCVQPRAEKHSATLALQGRSPRMRVPAPRSSEGGDSALPRARGAQSIATGQSNCDASPGPSSSPRFPGFPAIVVTTTGVKARSIIRMVQFPESMT